MRFTNGQPRSSAATSARHLSQIIAERHHELEAACQDFLGQLAVDPHALAARWDDFDAVLRDHMAAEEELIFPDLQSTDPQTGEELRTEHARIRELLDALGRDVQHHRIHTGRLRELVSLLHVHAAREDTTLYPWAQRSLARAMQRELLVRIGHGLRRLAQRL